MSRIAYHLSYASSRECCKDIPSTNIEAIRIEIVDTIVATRAAGSSDGKFVGLTTGYVSDARCFRIGTEWYNVVNQLARGSNVRNSTSIVMPNQ